MLWRPISLLNDRAQGIDVDSAPATPPHYLYSLVNSLTHHFYW
jgi:hypothetical protein